MEKYQYFEIKGRYYCLQQNPLELAWFLYSCSKSHQLYSGLTRSRLIKLLIRLIRHRFRLGSNGPVLELPVYGNLCLSVHRGYKVFNFHQKTVTKIFAPEIDLINVIDEIKRLQRASLLDFAPNVRRWSIKERWYEEDYVNGYPCFSNANSESMTFLKIYHSDIVPCLEQMILLQRPLTVNLTDYVNKTIDILEDSGLSSRELDMDKVSSIKRFIKSIVDRLRFEDNCQVDLVFSHGDFSLVNILRTKDGIKVIDWEGAGRRSILFDFYNYFFTELYYKRARKNLVQEIKRAISSLQLRLITKAPYLRKTLVSFAQMYRWLYYVERIHMLMERELSNRLLDVVIHSVEVFNYYEESSSKMDSFSISEK